MNTAARRRHQPQRCGPTARRRPGARGLALVLGMVILGLLDGLAGGTAPAASQPPDPYRLLLVPSANTRIYSDVVDALRKNLSTGAGKRISVTIYSPVELAQSVDRTGGFPQADLLIPIGTRAAVSISGYSSRIPVLFVLVPKTTYRSIIRRFHENFSAGRQHSALFVDHPVARHLDLARAVLPTKQRIGVLLGPTSRDQKARLLAAARARHLQLELRQVNDERELYQALQDVLAHADMLLSLPDRAVYNSHTIRNILITAFRYRKPVIGYSESLVKAGALTALYSTPQQIGRQLAEILLRRARDPQRRLPPPQAPEYSSVAVNYWVAQSLDIELPTHSEIERRIHLRPEPDPD
ncbi:MAG: ABC transporter substrate binding protein [Gammaproteobacteria bacterium]